ncbi:karyopherin Kap123 [Coccidioides immitis RMSCC 2394]|uniref:Karyopherin Kap123 n=1 Tax=Coccidioides immitis RMSCC 2394 TaxID=404692 RepID=A0A0J7AVG1_COCIT|nr:karyopherin Kap123 [Coccidioides immitis RMSCC 2394]
MDQERFLQQLHIVLIPTQGNVKEATATLQKEFYNNPEALLLLIHIFTSHNNTDLKQLAAVEARSLVSKHWLKIPGEQKPQIREQLLRSTLEEQAPLVRHSGARVISAIAKLDLQDGEWADLPGWLLQAATNSSKEVRAVGMYILFTILETLGDGFQGKFTELLQLFDKTIRDPESAEVRINTLLSLSKLAMHLDADEDKQAVRAFQNIFPAMVAVLKDATDEEDEDRVMQAFEVFQTLLGCEPQLLNPHLKDLVLFMNQLAANTNLAEETRTQAISFLMQCLRYRKLKIQGMQLGEQLTLTSLQIATELGDSDDDVDEITPARSALGLLDMMAQFLPPSQVVVPLLKALGQYFSNQNPDYRRAGIMALGMCVEGAPDFISTQMKEIFPVVLQMLSDPEPKVRQATLHGVARIADDLTEDVSKQHEQLMPLLLQNLASAMQEYKGEESGVTINITKASVAAIDAVVDALEEKDIVRYQGELVPVLHKLFQHPDFKIKALSASALGSIASSAGEAFLPYFDVSMHIMQEYATLKDSEEELELRASVTDAMGEMSASAGPERYKNYVEPLMHASEEALRLDHSRLKESTYIFWGAMSKVYGEDFTPYLGGVVKGLLDCLEQEDSDLEVSLGDAARDLIGQEVTIAGHRVRVADADDDDDVIEGMEGDDDDGDWEDFSTVTPIALEKEIAIEVLGDVITHTGQSYMPYFEKTIEHILPLADHAYEGVRKSTISTLHRAYAALWQVSESSGHKQKWEPGKPFAQPPPEIKKFGEILMTATIKMWAEEDDSATVADINRNVAENLRYCGPYIIADQSTLDRVVTLVDTIITKQHPCQQDFGAGEEDQEALEELSEFDWIVIDTALDVISGLATALGPDFVGLWPMFEKTVLKYATGSESLERSTAIGVLADLITGLGEAVTPFTGTFLTLFLRRLTDEDLQTRSNTTYAVGRLVEKSSSHQEIIQAYPAILEKLEPCLRIHESRLPDNAVGCLARMILKHKDHVPLADAIPALIDALPLTTDYDENDPIYHMICQLCTYIPRMSVLTMSLMLTQL